MLQIYFLYICTGAAAGFFAGLLGIGGGLVVVPLLTLIFSIQGDMSPELAMHVALGTSLSSILFTAVSSSRAHARRKSVLWNYVRGMAPAIALGTLSGSFLAAGMSGAGLKIFFVCFLLVVAHANAYGLLSQSAAKRAGHGRAEPCGFCHRRSFQPGGTRRRKPVRALSALVRRGNPQSGGNVFRPVLAHRHRGKHRLYLDRLGSARPSGMVSRLYQRDGHAGHRLHQHLFCSPGRKAGPCPAVGTLRKVFAVFLYITAARMLWSIIA